MAKTGFEFQDFKYMGRLGEIQFPFLFPASPLEYFDVQDFTRYHFI